MEMNQNAKLQQELQTQHNTKFHVYFFRFHRNNSCENKIKIIWQITTIEIYTNHGRVLHFSTSIARSQIFGTKYSSCCEIQGTKCY